MIGIAGYLPPAQETLDGVTKLIEQSQSDTFLLVLRLLFILLPIVLLIFALFFAIRFPLTPALHKRLNNYLTSVRKGEQPEEDGSELKKILIGTDK